jgi:hypothetical protein
MIESLEQGLKATPAIIGIFEKIAARVIGIANKREKKAELKRLIALLNETTISRTLNQGLHGYLRMVVEDFKRGRNKKEIEIAVEQIEGSISAMTAIIDEMAEKHDKTIIYENSAWNDLHSVIAGRRRLLSELQGLAMTKTDLARIEAIAESYESYSRRLGSISSDLAKHARKLDK